MNDDPKIKYLIFSGWRPCKYEFSIDGKSLWVHRRSSFACHSEVAYEVQKLNDEYHALPWYKKLHKKIFED